MFRRFLLLFGATVSMIGAVVLFMDVGLPTREQFTGYLDEDGQRVAPEVNALAPPINGILLDGGEFNLNDLRGAPVILNFWATWCVPCRVEMPMLQEVYDQYHATSGLRVVAVNQGESAGVVRAWVREQGLTFDIVLDESGLIGGAYWIPGLPATFVLSSEGLILYKHYGTLTIDQLPLE